MDRHWKRQQEARCGGYRCALYLRVDPIAWVMPVSDHLYFSAAPHCTHLLHHTRGVPPSVTSPSKSKERKTEIEFRRFGVLLRRLEELPIELLDCGGNTRIPATSRGRGEDNSSSSHDEASGLKGGLDCVARVLALSATSENTLTEEHRSVGVATRTDLSERRKLLCDRKDPFAHLTPRRLALTVIKSSIVVVAPILNEVVLESLDEEERRRNPSWSSNESRAGQGGGGFPGFMLNEGISQLTGRVFVDTRGNIVRTGQQEVDGDRGEEGAELMKALAKSLKDFPALAFRRVLHNVMSVTAQRILEWQAVVHLSKRWADRLTKNIALSALRKTKRMSRGKAAAKIFLTAGRALFFQNLALFIVDELFVAVRLGLQERNRRKNNPYSTDWEALLREMKEKTSGNAVFAVSMWAAGSLGAMVGTLVYPKRGPDLLSSLAEMGASALLG